MTNQCAAKPMNGQPDNRSYFRTNRPGATPDAPGEDECSSSIPWIGKLIYFPDHAVKVKRLFLLLAKNLGQFYSMDGLQREHDGHVTSEEYGYSAEEVKKARQRIRKAINRIKAKLAESGHDEHYILVHEDDGPGGDGYTMLYRHAKPSTVGCPKCGANLN